jgi:hypothetical protein
MTEWENLKKTNQHKIEEKITSKTVAIIKQYLQPK